MKILFLFLLLLTNIVYGQNNILRKYNFNEGGYTLLGFKQDYLKPNINNTKGSFYINDIKTLNKIKDSWILHKSVEECSTGTYYIIYICKESKPIESFVINYDCSTFSSSSGTFSFNQSELDKFTSAFTEPVLITKMFPSIKKAREAVAQLRNNSNVIMIYDNVWMKFDGHINCSYTSKTGNTDPEIIKKELESELNKLCPQDEFQVEFSRMDRDKLMFTIKCSKSMADEVKHSGITKDNDWLDYARVMDPNVKYFQTAQQH